MDKSPNKDLCPCGEKKLSSSAPCLKSSKSKSKSNNLRSSTRTKSKNKPPPKSAESELIESMIECDYCKQWWHPDCAGINRTTGKSVDIKDFSCLLCLIANSTIPGIHINIPNTTSTSDTASSDTTIATSTNTIPISVSPSPTQITDSHKSSFCPENTSQHPHPQETITLSNIPTEPPEKHQDFVVIIDNIDHQYTTSQSIKEEINKFYSEINIKFCYPLPKGGIAIHTSSEEEQNTLLSPWPTGAFKTNHRVKSHKPLSLSGKSSVIVRSIPTFLSEEEIKSNLQSTYKSSISVRRFKTRNRQTNRPIIKITTSKTLSQSWLRNGIALNNRLFPCEAYKKDNPTRCFKCQKFGHIAKFCKSSITKCNNCSENHMSFECSSSTTKCSNCSGNHPSSSLDCPLYQRRAEEITKRRGIERQFQFHHL